MGCAISQTNSNQIYQQITTPFQNIYVVPFSEFDTTLKRNFIVLNQMNIKASPILDQLKMKFKITQLFQIQQLNQFQSQNATTLNNILVILTTKAKDIEPIIIKKINIFKGIIIAVEDQLPIGYQQICQSKYGYKFKSLVEFNFNFLNQAMMEASNKRLLYICNKDIQLINRSNIINLVFSNREKHHSPFQFLQFLQNKGGFYLLFQKQLINKINSKTKSAKFILKDLFQRNSLIKQLIEVLAQTQNPGLLSHLGWLYSLLSHYIQDWYHQNKDSYKNKQFYIVQPMIRDEITKLIKSKGQNILFSTFQMGFSDSKLASAYLKQNPTYYMFMISIPGDLNDYLREIDFGFYEEDGRVIFNIQNFFSLDFFDTSKKDYCLTYGSLARQMTMRQKQFRYAALPSTKASNLRMAKLWDYHCYCSLFINSQLDLIHCLQMYDKYRQQTLPNIVKTGITNVTFGGETLQSTTATDCTMKSSYIGFNSQRNQMENIGDSYFEEGNVEESVKYYGSVQPVERGYAKVFHMYLEHQNENKFNQIYQFYQNLPRFQSKVNNKLLSMVLSIFSVYYLMKTDIKSATKKMNDVTTMLCKVFKQQFQTKYGFHSQALYNIPFYYIIIQIQAQLQKQKGNDDACQMIQRQFKQSWQYFKGIHLYWLP